MSTIAAALRSKLKVPVIGAPLFLVSNPALVVAQCSAGIVGSFPALNARGAGRESTLEEWLVDIKARLDDVPGAAPFAVNQIVHKSNKRVMDDMELIVKHRVPIVITSLGAREDINEAVHSYGGLVFHDVINNAFARKAVAKGADGLVAVAHGAGGHAGSLSPFALIEEIREWFDGPLALSGAIGSGRAVAAAIAAGADFGYVGSAFIATDEANASQGYKQALVDGAAGDIVYTNLFTGVHGNYLKPSIKAAGLDPDNLPASDPSKLDLGETAKAWRDIWGCGQGIAPIKAVLPAADVVKRFRNEFEQAQARLHAFA
ncbi:hypothetical protein M885DRAFT_543324 [Pelagophyceae sp. CCMP2097]|nr:hypothetical protein M885DRAFT_543324 [Pelagophyceae sp. CCMP2097]